jgi:hypothetical protein
VCTRVSAYVHAWEHVREQRCSAALHRFPGVDIGQDGLRPPNATESRSNPPSACARARAGGVCAVCIRACARVCLRVRACAHTHVCARARVCVRMCVHGWRRGGGIVKHAERMRTHASSISGIATVICFAPAGCSPLCRATPAACRRPAHCKRRARAMRRALGSRSRRAPGKLNRALEHLLERVPILARARAVDAVVQPHLTSLVRTARRDTRQAQPQGTPTGRTHCALRLGATAPNPRGHRWCGT